MDIRRVIIASLFALLLSGTATYFIYVRLSRQNEERLRMVTIVAAAKALQAGSVLKAEDLTLVDWPASLPLNGSFSKIDEVVGRPLIYPLGEKEPVLERDLAVSGSGIGLTVKIPPGMRATAVRSNEIVGVAGFLFPGSHVDVLTTFRPEGRAEPTTQTVLQNVEVLTAGQKIQPDPQGKPETVSVVTLLLSPEDSERLLLISSLGTIQFVLRNGSDNEKLEIRPVSLGELLAGPKKPAPPPAPVRVQRPQPVAAAPKPPDFYLVEIIQGDKRSEAKFPAATP